MSNMTRGMSGSVFVHGVLILSVLSVGRMAQEPPKMLVIDFSITKTAAPAAVNCVRTGTGEQPQSAASAKKPPLPQASEVAAHKSAVAPEMAPVRKKIVRPPAEVQADRPQTEPLRAATPAVTECARGQENNSDSGQQVASSAPVDASPGVNAASAASPSPATAPSAPEENGSGGAGAREQYVKAHFFHIKEGIQRSITYPLLARKKGWEGKVLVSFVICENGRVIDIHILESSGFEVLDNNAVATIKKLEPFPSPPVRAELIVPVVYRLS